MDVKFIAKKEIAMSGKQIEQHNETGESREQECLLHPAGSTIDQPRWEQTTFTYQKLDSEHDDAHFTWCSYHGSVHHFKSKHHKDTEAVSFTPHLPDHKGNRPLSPPNKEFENMAYNHGWDTVYRMRTEAYCKNTIQECPTVSKEFNEFWERLEYEFVTKRRNTNAIPLPMEAVHVR